VPVQRRAKSSVGNVDRAVTVERKALDESGPCSACNFLVVFGIAKPLRLYLADPHGPFCSGNHVSNHVSLSGLVTSPRALRHLLDQAGVCLFVCLFVLFINRSRPK
jgi:hypothetical protein